MTAPLVRLDKQRELPPSVLRRLRWNPHVLGAASYPMEAYPADRTWGVVPLDSGHHLRWRVDPRRGLPTAGFYVYTRSNKRHGYVGTHSIEFAEMHKRDDVRTWTRDVGEPRPLHLTHPTGFTIGDGGGVALPAGPAPLTITLPTSARGVRLLITHAPARAEVLMTHARHLIHYVRSERPEPEWGVECPDAIDQIHIVAPEARLLGLLWTRVPGDLAGWIPLARFPALGTAPLDAAGIAARVGSIDIPDDERDEHLTTVLDQLRSGPVGATITWPADDGGPGIELEPGMLLSTLTLQPRLAWAFGRYLVDPQPAWIPSDYLVVAGWFDPKYDPKSTKPSTDRGSGGAARAPATTLAIATTAAGPRVPQPFIPGGPALDDLVDVLVHNSGLLYFAPCYAVSPQRAWEPPHGLLSGLDPVTDEARRQLDDQGRALLELPLRAAWSLNRTDGLPLLAAQQTPLAQVTFGGPGAENIPRVVVSSSTNGGRLGTVEIVAPRLADLPGVARASLVPLDLFGHLTGPATTRTLALPASLYPTAPPPIGVIPEIVPPAGAAPPDLRVTLLWGGRLRLFHPNVQGFLVEWLQDTDLPANVVVQEALRNGSSLPWKGLPLIAAVQPRDAQIDSLEAALVGQVSDAVLLREGTAFLAGIRTDLRIAPGATGRLDGWSLEVGAQSFVVGRHTLGDDAWLFLELPGGAAGTPFAGFAEGIQQPYAAPWTLTPPATVASSNTIVRVSGAAPDLQALVPGSLITQGPLVFGVLARVPPAFALLDVHAGPQEPAAPSPAPLSPGAGPVKFDAPMTTVLPGVAIAAPTPSHARRVIWVRVGTVDFLGRPGMPTGASDAAWAKTFPPVPAAGPAVVRRSPPDAFGHCKLLVRFDKTLADHGCIVYRASDAQLNVVFERAKRKVIDRPAAAAVPAFAPLPAGFVWPQGGPQRPEDVTDPLKDFAGSDDMMRVFYNELRIDEGSGPRLVFLDAFERRGRMLCPGQPDKVFAAANDDPLELEDVVDRAGNRYLYLARPIDRADQEGGVSGVSLPGQGWDISAPTMPDLLPVLVTPTELIVRWRPVRDARVTAYRVTQTPKWQGGPAATVVKRAPLQFPSPIRVEGDRIALPDLVLTPAITNVTSVTTVSDGIGHLDEGFVMPGEQQFVWWCAAGNRVLVVVDPVAGGDVRARVPVQYALGVADGSAVNPAPLVLYRGVLDGESLELAPGTFARLLAEDSSGNFTDQTATGTWRDDGFLTSPAAFEEGEAVVLETAAPNGTRRTFGRCPAAPAQPLIAVTDGIIPLDVVAARLTAGDRPSGVFRASAVTQADGTGTPQPRQSGATDMIDGTSWYTSGFVRRLRNGVAMVMRWHRVSDGVERFLLSAPGGRPLRFLDGSVVVPPWDPAREVLAGVYERATVSVVGTSVTVPAGARDSSADVTADPTTGRLVTILPDGAPVRVQLQGGNEIAARFDPLQWRARRLGVSGLFGDGVLVPSELYTLEPDANGLLVPRTDRDRFGLVDVAPDGSVFVAKGIPSEGAKVQLEYNGDGVARTVDPRRCEWSSVLTAADVGRKWEIRVEAVCDFPPPVGEVTSRPAMTEVEVVPPANVDIRIVSAQWTAAPALEVQFSGPAALVYRVVAVSEATGRRFTLADPAGGMVVVTATATDGTALPQTEALSVEVNGSFPNAPLKTYAPSATHVDALVSEVG